MLSIERGMPTTLCPSVTSSDRPCAIPSVPSVVMNGGMPKAAISTPLPKPKHTPTASAAMKARTGEPVAITVTANMMEAKVNTAPIDRSRPSVMIMTVIGSASINRIVDCVRTLAMLAGVVNPGLSTPKIAHSTTSTIATPGTRVEPQRCQAEGAFAHWCIPRRTILASVSSLCASSPAIRPLRMT